jgi:adenosylhomocysteine nucleosidase
LVLAVFPFVSLFADTVILVALPSELDAVRKEVRLVGQPVQLAGHRVSIGYRKGEKICVAITGAGNLNSAMITQAVLTRYKIDRVISIGVAGNLNDAWKVGDVVIATDVINHQQGKETPGGFETKEQRPSAISHQLPGDYIGKCEELRSNVVEVARAVIAGALSGGTTNTTETLRQAQGDNVDEKLKAESQQPRATIRQGRLVSGDSFIASTAKRRWLRETFKADAVDMVSAGIARVCEANGVPYVIIRALSDNADEFASEDFARFVNAYKEPVTAEIAVRLIEGVATGSQTPSH